jgi:hypothetical protein
MNRHIVRLFERHKHSPRANKIILIKVMNLTSGKLLWTWHWTSVFCNLYITWMIKTSQSSLYSKEFLNTQHTRNVLPVLNVGVLRRISSPCRHQAASQSGSDVRHLVIQKQHSVRQDQWHWAAALFKFRWIFLCSCCSITDWQHRYGWYSGALCTEQDESRQHATAEISKVSSNVIPLIYNYTLPADIGTKVL